jgi:hypothetical protein
MFRRQLASAYDPRLFMLAETTRSSLRENPFPRILVLKFGSLSLPPRMARTRLSTFALRLKMLLQPLFE